MTNPTWPIGPARTRDGRKARIYATDGSSEYPIHGAVMRTPGDPDGDGEESGWSAVSWDSEGSYIARSPGEGLDLLPPKFTRSEAIKACALAVHEKTLAAVSGRDIDIAITHWEKLKAEGRIE